MAVLHLALHDDGQWQGTDGTDLSIPPCNKLALQLQGTGVRSGFNKLTLQLQGTGVRSAVQKPGRAKMAAVVSSTLAQLL